MKTDDYRLPSLFEMYLTLRTQCKISSVFGERKREGDYPFPFFFKLKSNSTDDKMPEERNV